MSKLKVDEIRSADRSVSSSANITLADDGNVSLGGTLSAGTIGSSVAVQDGFGVVDRSSKFDYGTGFSNNNHPVRAYSFNGFMFVSLNCVKSSISHGDTIVQVNDSNFYPDQKYSAPNVSHEGDLAFCIDIKTDGDIIISIPVNAGNANYHVVANFWYRF